VCSSDLNDLPRMAEDTDHAAANLFGLAGDLSKQAARLSEEIERLFRELVEGRQAA
jgi:hypothetical protein